MSLADAVDLLLCPACPAGEEVGLTLLGQTLTCPRGHSFDVARQGYVNLLGGPPPRHADTAAMVTARDRVLSGPAYAPLIAGVREVARRVLAAGTVDRSVTPDGDDRRGPAVLDCGAGTGHYLAATLSAQGGAAVTSAGLSESPAADRGRVRGVALDISTAAARRAARWGLPLASVVADGWRRLPVRSGSVVVVLSVFAPRQPSEFARVLGGGGAVVTVHPRPDHLVELRERLGLLGVHPDKAGHLDDTFSPALVRTESRLIERRVRLDPAVLRDLVAMGPNAFHHSAGPDDLPATGLQVTLAVEVSTWRTQ